MFIYIVNINSIKSKDVDKIIKKNNFNINLNSSIQSKIGKILIKKFVSNDKIYYSDYGKPYINGKIKFNLSHSKEYLVFVIGKGFDVGIDIEKIMEHKHYTSISKKYFSNIEDKYIENDLYRFLKIWTRKESFIKCLGLSISNLIKMPKLIKNKIVYNRYSFFIKTFEYNKYIFSVTYKSNRKKNILIREIFLENL